MQIRQKGLDLSRFKALCRGAGLRLTPQRMEIYAELAKASDHPSPETVHHRLIQRIPSLSLDTVYRTLATFARQGLIQKVETVQSQARFEAVQDSHHHLICKECHEIIDFPWPSFDTARLPKKADSWGIIERKSAVVYGICRRCGKTSRRKR
jgi:Fur family transcriptional regulator, peroxide stress response regulator